MYSYFNDNLIVYKFFCKLIVLFNYLTVVAECFSKYKIKYCIVSEFFWLSMA